MSFFLVTNLNRNLTQFRPPEIHCQPDPTELIEIVVLDVWQPKYALIVYKWNLRKRVFHQSKLEIFTMKSP